jgi:hypothetical protein
MDTLTRTERSKRMALIHGKNTKPELLVRKIARSCGYKFRLHVPDLPGKPDIVFPKQRKVIFVHGCFWIDTPVRVALLPSFPNPSSASGCRNSLRIVGGDLHNIARFARKGNQPARERSQRQNLAEGTDGM